MKKSSVSVPFEIYDASALLLNKKQSSTYNKYACGCFLYAPSICGVYFQKCWFKNIRRIYCVARGFPEVYTDVHFWKGYFKRLTESMFSKAVEVCASTSCCTKRIGTGFSLYHSSSTFHSLMVRFSSSKPCQTMSVRGHCLTSSFCLVKNIATLTGCQWF